MENLSNGKRGVPTALAGLEAHVVALFDITTLLLALEQNPLTLELVQAHELRRRIRRRVEREGMDGKRGARIPCPCRRP